MIVMKKSKKKTKQPHHFVVKAQNGKVIATSENYRSKQGMKKGIASLLKELRAPKPVIMDECDAEDLY